MYIYTLANQLKTINFIGIDWLIMASADVCMLLPWNAS